MLSTDSSDPGPRPERRPEAHRAAMLTEGALAGDVAAELVSLHHQHFGRGPAAARAYIGENILVCVLTDVYTQGERTLVGLQREDLVREVRLTYQRAMEAQYVEIVQRITGRTVVTFVGSVTFDPDQAIELFTLGPASEQAELPVR